MQDVERLRAELEELSPEDRAERIRAEQEKARAAEAKGAAEPEALAKLDRLAAEARAALDGTPLFDLAEREPGRLRDVLLAELAQHVKREELGREAGVFVDAETQCAIAATACDLAQAANALDEIHTRQPRMLEAPLLPKLGHLPSADQVAEAAQRAALEAGATAAQADAAFSAVHTVFEQT